MFELQFQPAKSYLFVFIFKMLILTFSWYLQGIFLIGPILQHKSRHRWDKLCHIWGGFSLVRYLLIDKRYLLEDGQVFMPCMWQLLIPLGITDLFNPLRFYIEMYLSVFSFSEKYSFTVHFIHNAWKWTYMVIGHTFQNVLYLTVLNQQ